MEKSEEDEKATKSKFMKQCDVRPSTTLHGTTFHQNFGQYIYILRNTDVVDSMVKKANLEPSHVVLEVSPCTGNLTVKLLEQPSKVIVYEINSRLARTLARRVESNPHRDKLEIIERNVLKMRLPPFDVCVAHVPYQISNAFVTKLVSYRPPFFKRAILLLQRGFVKQLIAKPGEKHYCFLSLTMRAFAKVKVLAEIQKENFSPVPPVDYNIVRIMQKRKLPDVSYYEWLNITEPAFKMEDRSMKVVLGDNEMVSVLESTYRRRFGYTSLPERYDMKGRVLKILKESGYLNRRARDMDVDDFVTLLKAFLKDNIHFY